MTAQVSAPELRRGSTPDGGGRRGSALGRRGSMRRPSTSPRRHSRSPPPAPLPRRTSSAASRRRGTVDAASAGGATAEVQAARLRWHASEFKQIKDEQSRDLMSELGTMAETRLEAYQRKFSAFRLQDVAGPGSGSKLGRRASQFVSPMHAMAVVRRQAELEMQASGAINGGAGGEEAPSSPTSPTRRPTVMLPPRKISYTAASAGSPNPKRGSIMA